MREFEVDNKGLTLVYISTKWCQPCKFLKPIIKQLDIDNDELTVLYVDGEEDKEIAEYHGTSSVPALFLYKDGKLEKSTFGFMPKAALNKWIFQ